ncbi:OmpA family protein [Formosa algae]|uniref:Outer membrane protein OmpA-like peptidoglycan-associated protein n=1 Tax=Formosa algae TaxID=225843 RepID=A0A9X0YKK1_9FLAO|nr:OmpA family protein [Formosa algae]MBP1840487.1 outer membrane protein OmpA-like peptidoglycan-associated protein [Formosa algae]MDQ0336979.1 outer membrane protein OmpA-like peptidoglycan-associated protein [Formosa algae]OEI80861.1 cell envelope biogenesis protein OmpA [Formosa algae]
MKNKITLYSIVWFCITLITISTVRGQEKKLIQASQDYEKLDYVNAQKIYLSVAENGYKSEELYTKLANSYYFNAQYDQAVKWYDSLFNMVEKPKNNIVYLRYSQALKAKGQADKAMIFYDAFVTENNIKDTPLLAKDYLELIKKNSGRYTLKPLEQIYDEDRISFGHVVVKDTLYYASTKKAKTFLNKKSAWDGLSYLSLYKIKIDSVNQANSNPKMLKGHINGKFHESSPVFSSDNNTMYFTRSNKTLEADDDDYKLKIYRSVKVNNIWQESVELSINDDDFSTAHPALNSDGTKLYFSSDRPGGYGESDIYVSIISSSGIIGAPKNLGPEINTSGKETFPFVTANNELYFSSDGHFGLGGLDVFYIKIIDNHYGNLLNIGEPLNSYADDFAFGIDPISQRGFISSNRSAKTGEFVYDNIFAFKETAPIVDLYFSEIEGVVTDKQTGLPISGASVSLSNRDGEFFAKVFTDDKGFYKVETKKFQSYLIKAEKERYDTDENISESNQDSQNIDFQLQQNIVDLEPGMDLADVLNIPIIYFDYDKSNIREDAEVELQKILVALHEYPNLKLEIRSHTDSRGSDAYNLKLSSSRAQSTLEYLVSRDIDKDRLLAKGFGETQLVNGCSNGVDCSEPEHENNRRSEFIIIE